MGAFWVQLNTGASLVPANSVSTIPLSPLSIPPDSTTSITNECSSTLGDPLQLGLNSVESRSFQGPSALESEVLNFIMENVMVCPVSTIAHVPCSVYPLLARVLSVELRKACSSIWGFVCLSMFAKLVLCTPSTSRSQHCRFVISSILLDRLHLWNQPGGISHLWASLQNDLRVCKRGPGRDLVVHFANPMPCFGPGRVDTVMLFSPFLLRALLALMMTQLTRICLLVTPPLHVQIMTSSLPCLH